MPIKVNGERHPWREGITVEALMQELKFSFPLKTVFIKGKRIPKGEHPYTLIADGDEIDVVHLMGGG